MGVFVDRKLLACANATVPRVSAFEVLATFVAPVDEAPVAACALEAAKALKFWARGDADAERVAQAAFDPLMQGLGLAAPFEAHFEFVEAPTGKRAVERGSLATRSKKPVGVRFQLDRKGILQRSYREIAQELTDVVMHEMVHYEQAKRSKGKYVEYEDDAGYYERPHELEAHALDVVREVLRADPAADFQDSSVLRKSKYFRKLEHELRGRPQQLNRLRKHILEYAQHMRAENPDVPEDANHNIHLGGLAFRQMLRQLSAQDSDLWIRVHWAAEGVPEAAFASANALSAPWGYWQNRLDSSNVSVRTGYSACMDAEALIKYIGSRRYPGSGDAVIIFEGTEIGVGDDDEALVMPKSNGRQLRVSWDEFVRDYELNELEDELEKYDVPEARTQQALNRLYQRGYRADNLPLGDGELRVLLDEWAHQDPIVRKRSFARLDEVFDFPKVEAFSSDVRALHGARHTAVQDEVDEFGVHDDLYSADDDKRQLEDQLPYPELVVDQDVEDAALAALEPVPESAGEEPLPIPMPDEPPPGSEYNRVTLAFSRLMAAVDSGAVDPDTDLYEDVLKRFAPDLWQDFQDRVRADPQLSAAYQQYYVRHRSVPLSETPREEFEESGERTNWSDDIFEAPRRRRDTVVERGSGRSAVTRPSEADSPLFENPDRGYPFADIDTNGLQESQVNEGAAVRDYDTPDTLEVETHGFLDPDVVASKQGAGIIPLAGMDDRIARDVVTAIQQTGITDYEPASIMLVIRKTFQLLGMTGPQIATMPDRVKLKKPDADARFAQTLLVFGGDSGQFQFVPPGEGGVPRVYCHLQTIFEQTPPEQVYSGVRWVMAHELRHAIDWAYNPVGWRARATEYPDYDVETPEGREMHTNDPLEQVSLPSDVAAAIWHNYGDSWKHLSGAQLWAAVAEGSPLQGKRLEAIEEAKKPALLQRVVKELQRLSTEDVPQPWEQRSVYGMRVTATEVLAGWPAILPVALGLGLQQQQMQPDRVMDAPHGQFQLDTQEAPQTMNLSPSLANWEALAAESYPDEYRALQKHRRELQQAEELVRSAPTAQHKQWLKTEQRATAAAEAALRERLMPETLPSSGLVDPVETALWQGQRPKWADKWAEQQVTTWKGRREAAGPKLVERLKNRWPELASQIGQLAADDPTGDWRWLDWSVRQLRLGATVEALTAFLQEAFAARDVFEPTRHKTLAGAAAALNKLQEAAASAGAEIVYQGEGWRVTRINRYDTLQERVPFKPWCVTWDDPHHWDDYTRSGQGDYNFYLIEGPTPASPYLFYQGDAKPDELRNRQNQTPAKNDAVHYVLAAAGLEVKEDTSSDEARILRYWNDFRAEVERRLYPDHNQYNRGVQIQLQDYGWTLQGDYLCALGRGRSLESAANDIVSWAEEDDEISDKILEGRVDADTEARGYVDAWCTGDGATYIRLSEIPAAFVRGVFMTSEFLSTLTEYADFRELRSLDTDVAEHPAFISFFQGKSAPEVQRLSDFLPDLELWPEIVLKSGHPEFLPLLFQPNITSEALDAWADGFPDEGYVESVQNHPEEFKLLLESLNPTEASVGAQRVEARSVLASGPSIVVTVPVSRQRAVDAEEADVAQREALGETGLGYYWEMGRLPKEQPDRIYFVERGQVSAYHDVTSMDPNPTGRGGRIYMSTTIHPVDPPVPMQGFRGFRYWQMPKTATVDPVPTKPKPIVVYHGGKRLVRSVDMDKVQSTDVGWYGSGFYVTTRLSTAEVYGNVVSMFELDPAARILRAHWKYARSPAATRRLVEEHVSRLPGLRADPDAVAQEFKTLAQSDIEWVHRVDELAEADNYDVVWFSDDDIVVKNEDVLTFVRSVPPKERAERAERTPGDSQVTAASVLAELALEAGSVNPLPGWTRERRANRIEFLQARPENAGIDVAALALVDPTGNKQYLTWLVNQQRRGLDVSGLRELLERYHTVKQQQMLAPVARDINRLSVEGLQQAVQEAERMRAERDAYAEMERARELAERQQRLREEAAARERERQEADAAGADDTTAQVLAEQTQPAGELDGYTFTRVLGRDAMVILGDRAGGNWCVGYPHTSIHWDSYCKGDFELYEITNPADAEAPYLLYFGGPHADELKDRNDDSVSSQDPVWSVIREHLNRDVDEASMSEEDQQEAARDAEARFLHSLNAQQWGRSLWRVFLDDQPVWTEEDPAQTVSSTADESWHDENFAGILAADFERTLREDSADLEERFQALKHGARSFHPDVSESLVEAAFDEKWTVDSIEEVMEGVASDAQAIEWLHHGSPAAFHVFQEQLGGQFNGNGYRSDAIAALAALTEHADNLDPEGLAQLETWSAHSGIGDIIALELMALSRKAWAQIFNKRFNGKHYNRPEEVAEADRLQGQLDRFEQLMNDPSVSLDGFRTLPSQSFGRTFHLTGAGLIEALVSFIETGTATVRMPDGEKWNMQAPARDE